MSEREKPMVMYYLRYVPHAQREEYEKRGWRVVNEMADDHHGQYSVLMVYEGEGEPQ